jgi:predicted  nucleic acid-binding Zn-ribbon protein
MRPVRDLAQMEYLSAITKVIEVVKTKAKIDKDLDALLGDLIDVSAYVSYLELERRAYDNEITKFKNEKERAINRAKRAETNLERMVEQRNQSDTGFQI